MRLLNLTGDGLSDILVTRDQHFLWFQCLGEAGYSEPQHIARVHDLNQFPDVYFDDPSGRVRLADMSGDGLNDIVLIHNGRIDYWPNLGYGHFGRRITMAQSPHLPDNVNPRQVFLVDLDGTGCADLVYVNHCQVHFWFNQSGNGWSEKQTIQGTPYITDLSAIQFTDFFGTGTTSLIWSYDYQNQSDGNYKVLDFCGGLKPHLLIEMDNNMGARTRVQYAASTQFYLEDKAAGTPWVTHLPFPVQVLEKTEAIDHIGKTKQVTSYKYHHGYYDGREREFRGFGRVDQYDTEAFEVFSESSLHGGDIEFDNQNRAHHVPPVLTKTWFHSGVYFDEDNVSPSGSFYDHNDLMEAYRQEFYPGDHQAFVLDNHQVEHSDNPHEAYRVLRGVVLRSEVFALDGTDKAEHPYTVAENRFRVQELQSKDDNNHGVYLTTQLESVSYQYERNPADPRIGQNLVLAVDEYGQVTDSLAIGYPRRQPPPELPEQAELKLIYTKTDYINKPDEPDFYYLGIPCQTRTYEVTGANWATGEPQLKANEFAGIIAPPLIPGDFRPFEWQRPDGHVGLEKRIIEWQRSYFRTDASPDVLDITWNANGQPIRTLANRLPLGEIDQLALPYEGFTAACTDDLLALNFDGPANVSATMLLDGGYHQETDISGYWWVTSGQQAFDRDLFYLTDTSRDPFGFDSRISYDEYGLAAEEAVDALENKVQAKTDYRVLQPDQVTDPNGNRSAVVFDTLGLVVGSAMMGKESENFGDLLTDEFQPDLTQSEIDDFIADTRANAVELLNTATTRIVYDLHRFKDTGQPPFAASLARETHASDSVPIGGLNIQISFSYSDGFGRTVQTRVQAEPDRATPTIPKGLAPEPLSTTTRVKRFGNTNPFSAIAITTASSNTASVPRYSTIRWSG